MAYSALQSDDANLMATVSVCMSIEDSICSTIPEELIEFFSTDFTVDEHNGAKFSMAIGTLNIALYFNDYAKVDKIKVVDETIDLSRTFVVVDLDKDQVLFGLMCIIGSYIDYLKISQALMFADDYLIQKIFDGKFKNYTGAKAYVN